MGKLIDADALRDNIIRVSEEYVSKSKDMAAMEDLVRKICGLVDAAQEVDAIHVSWIHSQIIDPYNSGMYSGAYRRLLRKWDEEKKKTQ